MATKESGQPFDAVMLDIMVRGGMGGKETIQELRAQDNNVKAIVSSGYSADPVMEKFSEYGFCASVPKPYEIHELTRVLHDIIMVKSDSENGKSIWYF
ncbi:MAG: response regulator [Planctomycetes bacterium]|nr:response regulator [Planctomycetota bacterium]